jgi:O-antigen/teichoic acid export membrane protein
VLKSIGSTWVVTVVTILVVFIVTPFVIEVLGEEKYGIWLTITALTGFLDLIRGGLPAATVKHLAEAVGATNDRTRPAAITKVVHSALYLYGFIVATCVVAGLGMWIAWRFLGRPVPPVLQDVATVAFFIVVIKVSLGFVAHLPGAIMEAHEDFVARNTILLGGVLVTNALIFGLLSADANLLYMAAAVTAGTLVEFVGNSFFAMRRYKGVSPGLSERDNTAVNELFHYSAWVLVLAAGSRLAFNTDAVVISTFDAYESVAFYNIANQIALYTSEFLAAVAIVVMPRAARLRAAGDSEGLKKVFLQWSKVSTALALLVGMYLLFMGPEFLGFWITPEYKVESGPSLQILIFSFLFFLPMRGVAIPILMAVGDVRVPALAYIGMGLLNVAISVPLVLTFGIVGAAIGTAIPNVIFAALVFQLACRETRVSVGRYLSYAVLKPLLGIVPVVGWLCLCRFVFDAEGFIGLLYSGVVTVGLFAVVFVAFVFRNDPYSDVWNHSRVRRFTGRG